MAQPTAERLVICIRESCTIERSGRPGASHLMSARGNVPVAYGGVPILRKAQNASGRLEDAAADFSRIAVDRSVSYALSWADADEPYPDEVLQISQVERIKH